MPHHVWGRVGVGVILGGAKLRPQITVLYYMYDILYQPLTCSHRASRVGEHVLTHKTSLEPRRFVVALITINM